MTTLREKLVFTIKGQIWNLNLTPIKNKRDGIIILFCFVLRQGLELNIFLLQSPECGITDMYHHAWLSPFFSQSILGLSFFTPNLTRVASSLIYSLLVSLWSTAPLYCPYIIVLVHPLLRSYSHLSPSRNLPSPVAWADHWLIYYGHFLLTARSSWLLVYKAKFQLLMFGTWDFPYNKVHGW
jgi:hypothetical protein